MPNEDPIFVAPDNGTEEVDFNETTALHDDEDAVDYDPDDPLNEADAESDTAPESSPNNGDATA